ncbi:tRNA-(ms[2]io[6]A)-hydroxylase [Algoriphagus halophytocola]|uniref:tRNA-(Ms[2]io[6]A)-hydroxylase n=1 Tax=Algoriphagus halophytocola TaxID=2991499 RepID=A0ABY6MJV1_9BACT|nr:MULTISPECIES: tRNA-(ms[2]io[6]A)-hydroxylase [unclassified Algoriphagus]UZD24065.1 tRNA-(ms[2]io[6]A)-hydroxylase [Algoriphagus sp. TR-M5]WBL41436.1 tRNA-(ms[2]io[6]A)-hydroxylase [Algoriphagus sp. TR-M9]
MSWEESTKQKMLHLKLPTDPRWAGVAGMQLEDILTDHAYCEQKAASSCISLILRFNDLDEIVDTLTPIVAEEWGHFERVLEQIRKRDLKFGFPRKDEYVIELTNFVKKGGSRMQQLTEQLLMNALIEARSCERFKLLSRELEDAELKSFYYELMVSEAGHYVTFIELAKKYFDPVKVNERWQEWLEFEAKVISNLGVRGDRMH